jgi:hypothetical protein
VSLLLFLVVFVNAIGKHAVRSQTDKEKENRFIQAQFYRPKMYMHVCTSQMVSGFTGSFIRICEP